MEQIEVTIERNIWGHPPGLRVIRFSNEDVIQNIEGVYEELSKTITAINSCCGSSRSAKPAAPPFPSPVSTGNRSGNCIRVCG